jgi:hypothetical protein
MNWSCHAYLRRQPKRNCSLMSAYKSSANIFLSTFVVNIAALSVSSMCFVLFFGYVHLLVFLDTDSRILLNHKTSYTIEYCREKDIQCSKVLFNMFKCIQDRANYFVFFETGSCFIAKAALETHYVTQIGPECAIPLPQPHECWDIR